MELVRNNPYRVLGIMAGATAKEQNTRTKRLKMYLDADEVPESANSFPVLGNLELTVSSVDAASDKLNLEKDKMTAALFWFYEGNRIIDEAAFDALKNGDKDEALQLWTCSAVTATRASSFFNKGTLLLCDNKLEEAIKLKLAFLESEYVTDFICKIVDQTYQITRKEIELLFLSELKNNLAKDDFAKLIHIISCTSFVAQADFLKSCADDPINQIDRCIEFCKAQRKKDKKDVYIVGQKLCNDTSSSLVLLKTLIGTSDIRYATLADRLAEEILQCGIDYFKYYKDSAKTDLGNTTMELLVKGKEIAMGEIAKQRCAENIKNLQSWIDDKPKREESAKIENEMLQISQALRHFDGGNQSIENATALVHEARPLLKIISDTLGKNNQLYLKISSSIVHKALYCIIDVVNREQNNFIRNFERSSIKTCLKNAWKATLLIQKLDMEPALREHFNKNMDSLKHICFQLDVDASSAEDKRETLRDICKWLIIPAVSIIFILVGESFDESMLWIFAMIGYIGIIVSIGGLIFGLIGLIIYFINKYL